MIRLTIERKRGSQIYRGKDGRKVTNRIPKRFPPRVVPHSWLTDWVEGEASGSRTTDGAADTRRIRVLVPVSALWEVPRVYVRGVLRGGTLLPFPLSLFPRHFYSLIFVLWDFWSRRLSLFFLQERTKRLEFRRWLYRLIKYDGTDKDGGKSVYPFRFFSLNFRDPNFVTILKPPLGIENYKKDKLSERGKRSRSSSYVLTYRSRMNKIYDVGGCVVWVQNVFVGLC